MEIPQRIQKMTRDQYETQNIAAKRELKRSKEEVIRTLQDLEKALLDHNIALGYKRTVEMFQF